MKVKTINRAGSEYTRERKSDLHKVHTNLDPALHPFEKATEYTRALNAVKLERVFAKPFIAAFPHGDGVTCLARNPEHLNSLLSGCEDGTVRVWDIPARRCLRALVGHTKRVTGLAATPSGDACISCSTDRSARLFRVPFAPLEAGSVEAEASATLEFHGKFGFRGLDHHWRDDVFATAGERLDVWDHARSEPTVSFQFGADTLTAVRFNPAEPDILASCGSDRSVALYDLRHSTPIRKLVMQTRSNAVAWNPMEAFNFTVANEDCSLYTYDMRKLGIASCVHQDFVSAVMDVDYSPTGREFVAGGYDRSVRIFAHGGGRSREVYHTKRMQRVFATRFSGDGSYVFSGSDDMNVRVWKANASEQLGTLVPKERNKHSYEQALINRYRHLHEIKRIARHRQVPAAIYRATKLRRTITDADSRRLQRKVAHSAPGSVAIKPARKRKIIGEQE